MPPLLHLFLICSTESGAGSAQQGCSTAPHCEQMPDSQNNLTSDALSANGHCSKASGDSGSVAQQGRPSAPQLSSQKPSLLQEPVRPQLRPGQQGSPPPPQAAQMVPAQMRFSSHTDGTPSSELQQRKPLDPQPRPAYRQRSCAADIHSNDRLQTRMHECALGVTPCVCTPACVPQCLDCAILEFKTSSGCGDSCHDGAGRRHVLTMAMQTLTTAVVYSWLLKEEIHC